MKSSRVVADGQFKHMFKVIIIGESYVGKSHIFQTFCDAVSRHSSTEEPGVKEIGPTTSVDLRTRIVMLDETSVKLHIWDTMGQEKFASMTRAYYRATQGVLVVFDVTVRESFSALHRWLVDVSQNC